MPLRASIRRRLRVVATATVTAMFAVLMNAPIRMSRATPASSAELLVAQGKGREAAGDEITALKRYSDALAIDPTSEGAYFALAALRIRRGELDEAEEVYSVALARVPAADARVDAMMRRGDVRHRRGRWTLASEDFARALKIVGASGSAREVTILRALVALRRDQKEPAAELAGWRRLLAIGNSKDDGALVKEASVQARALGIFVGDVDPALRGRSEDDEVRRALAAIAKRGG